jgi:hypothetical protein
VFFSLEAATGAEQGLQILWKKFELSEERTLMSIA